MGVALAEELQVAAAVLERSVRSTFSDALVKVKGFSLTSSGRQGQREQRKRYMAWGQEALQHSTGTEKLPTKASALVMNLLVRHASLEDLSATIDQLVTCIESCFEE